MARILIIDDDQHLLTALAVVFEQAVRPITADTAMTAEHALRLIEQIDYDTIVSDFRMPGFNGIDFRWQIFRVLGLLKPWDLDIRNAFLYEFDEGV